MALIHADNFDIYGLGFENPHLLDGIFSENRHTELRGDPDDFSPGTVLRTYDLSNEHNGLRLILPNSRTIVGAAWRWWIKAVPSIAGDVPCVTWYDPANVAIVSVCINVLGGITIKNGDPTGPINKSTPGPVLSARGWYHIETKIDTANATCEVRVEGVVVLTTAIPNGYIGTQNLKWGVFSAAGPMNEAYYKDLVVWDGTGPYNNDFLGSVLVVSLRPVADVALNWTPSTGTDGFSILDNSPPNDAQYISAPFPPPAAYVADLTNLPPNVTSVKGVVSIVRATKADGGDASLQISMVSGNATANGSNRPITITPTYWRDVFEQDPATNAAWTPGALDAVKQKMNRTA